MIGRYPPNMVRSIPPEPCTNRTTGNGAVPSGNLRSPTILNDPDSKVISSTLAGWGCLVQAGRSITIASRTADSLVKVCLWLEMIWVYIVISL
jgi:hypothetical protein